MEENQEKPQTLEPEQQQWMQKFGLTIHMTLVPEMNRLITPDRPRGADPSQVQIFTRISSNEDHKIIHSDYVRNTRGQLKKLMKAQFDLAMKELLAHRFDSSGQIKPKPKDDDEE